MRFDVNMKKYRKTLFAVILLLVCIFALLNTYFFSQPSPFEPEEISSVTIYQNDEGQVLTEEQTVAFLQIWNDMKVRPHYFFASDRDGGNISIEVTLQNGEMRQLSVTKKGISVETRSYVTKKDYMTEIDNLIR